MPGLEDIPMGFITAAANKADQYGGIGDKYIQRRRERKQEDRIFNRNRKAALDDWQIQAAYDHPKAQMARLVEAGLNPKSITAGYSFEGAPSISQDSTPHTSTYQEPNEFRTQAMNLESFETTRLQNQNLESQQKLIDAQTLKALTEVDAKSLDTQFKRDTYDDMLKGVGLRNDLTSTNIDLIKQKRVESQENVKRSEEMRKKIAADTKFTIDENQRKELMSALERKKVTQETKLIVEKILTEKRQSLLDYMKLSKDEIEKQRIRKQIELIDQQIESMSNNEVLGWARAILKK